MLFIKGTKEAPQCGFTKRLIDLLAKYPDCTYGTFNILADEEVCDGLPTYSNWPTYPQIYVNGELIGGIDILTELHEEGELGEILTARQKKIN